MAEPTYPILVRSLCGPDAFRIACEDCDATGTITPDDLNQDAVWPCPVRCGGEATFKYVEADECANCGKLGFFDGRSCSRRCALQVEHAESLRGRDS